MTEIEKLQEFIALMRQEGIRHLRVKEGDSEFELEMGSIVAEEKIALSEEKNDNVSLKSPPSIPEEAHYYITSPMVGIFHRSPSPQTSPFVEIGDIVDESHVVCIVEAMKVMNEVKAGVAGRIAEILIEDNSPVEFGTKLYKICIKS